MQSNLATRLLPQSFVESWSRRTQAEFVAAFGDTLMLVVRLEDFASELAAALTASYADEGRPLRAAASGIAFSTVAADSEHEVRRSACGDPLHRRLASAPHFVVPLRKAIGRPFPEQLWVGRALNNDVVLRHASVSKSHAWFECDRERALYVHDANSKNATALNGRALEPRVPYLVEAGDEIQFGQIATVLFRPDAIWSVIALGARIATPPLGIV